MSTTPTKNILVLACYFKGERFMQQAARRGAKVFLLTLEKHADKAWPRESISEIFLQNNEATLQQTIYTVAYLARSRRIDLIVPMDDYDVETAAALREHLRIPGMGDSVARLFRDKLATRVKAKEAGIPVPPFVQVVNHEALTNFMSEVPAPWMFKPRSEASATGIIKIESPEQLWQVVAAKGDRQSYYLLEKYLPGDVFHVDSLMSEGKVVFSAVHRCGKPPFNVAHGGGIFTSSTVERGSAEEKALIELNTRVLTTMGMTRGASHTEYIRHATDGKLYLLETSARVGGAHIAEMVEASSGVNLWEEWANIELDPVNYKLPTLRQEYGAVAMTLARQKQPDLSVYNDPEVFFRAPEEHHAGIVLRAKQATRVKELLDTYQQRFMRDFFASLPATEKPAH